MEGVFWYVYMLQSIGHPEHYYVGMTESLPERLKAHNAGKVPHTSKFLPWRIETAVAFRDKTKDATAASVSTYRLRRLKIASPPTAILTRTRKR